MAQTRERRQTTQNVTWFWDLYSRRMLELDPPYQRRSVWNQEYKDYFVETILLHYPAPAVFLYEEISDEGHATYAVVDGKQRLNTIFEFVSNEFPVGEKCVVQRLRGQYFKDLSSEDKKSFWTYQFSVEYLPTTDENTLNSIFDRINRHVAKLTPQELRHARFGGEFASTAEELSEHMENLLGRDFPKIATSSKRQMKDIELVSQLLLLTEEGISSYSQDELDAAYSARDSAWEGRQVVEQDFRSVVQILSGISNDLLNGVGKRLRNQADFYSLYGALLELSRSNDVPSQVDVNERLKNFFKRVTDEQGRPTDDQANRYYQAARSASNDAKPRAVRVEIVKDVIAGRLGLPCQPQLPFNVPTIKSSRCLIV